MLRKLVGRVFGFDAEIEGLRGKIQEHSAEIEGLLEQIKDLSWDTSFGVWTRGAFLQFCHVMPRGARMLAFIDLDEIHMHNEKLGYSEVDRRVKATFSVSFRRSDLVARWYSGDEIVILFDTDLPEVADRKLAELRESAQSQGLSFKATVGTWDVGSGVIEDVVKELSDALAMGSGGPPR